MFANDIKVFVIDRLKECEGRSVYGADLYHELTLPENKDGYWIADVEDARRYVEHNAFDALLTVAYFHTEMDLDIDVTNWPLLTFYMLYRGVMELVNELHFIQRRWDDEFTLDAKSIKTICNQVKRSNYGEE